MPPARRSSSTYSSTYRDLNDSPSDILSPFSNARSPKRLVTPCPDATRSQKRNNRVPDRMAAVIASLAKPKAMSLQHDRRLKDLVQKYKEGK